MSDIDSLRAIYSETGGDLSRFEIGEKGGAFGDSVTSSTSIYRGSYRRWTAGLLRKFLTGSDEPVGAVVAACGPACPA